eukprot:TRINITY_DN17200_c0_g1_i1.p1 TRINITY_DN17200_c0_g1~~TRINITY_DN17200_c0_g1_i1.p1  ORF type:complete len:1258 (-),score=382.07 TRINITY_DN17200_c0_g1_i1:1352-4936(-)
MAVNCLGSIVQKFSKELVVDMVTELGNLAVSDSAGSAKDNYSQGIRTIIKALPKDFAAPAAQKLAPIMLKGINNNSANIDHRIAHLVIIGDLLRNYGKEFADLQKDLLACFVQLLEHPKAPLRKEVSLAVGAFVNVAEEQEFENLMTNLIQKTQEKQVGDELLFNYVQTIAIVSRNAGSRIEVYLEKIVPLLDKFCNADKKVDQSDASDEVIELREASLLAFASLIRECPSEIGPHLPRIVGISMKLISNDPNYEIAGQGAEAEGGGDDFGDDGGDWGDEGGDWGNDFGNTAIVEGGDSSWKVRLASVFVLTAFVEVKGDILKDYFADIFALLMQRFNERDFNVRMEVFKAFVLLLRAAVVMEDKSESTGEDLPRLRLVRQRSFFYNVSSQLPQLLDQLVAQFKTDQLVAQKGVLMIFLELVKIVRSDLQQSSDEIFQIIVQAIRSSDAELKLNGLRLVGQLLSRPTNDDDMKAEPLNIPNLQDVTNALISVLSDAFVKTKALALSVIADLAISGRSSVDLSSDMRSQSFTLLQACVTVIEMTDVDQLIKESSIIAVSSLLARFGDVFPPEVSRRAVRVVVTRLENEFTQVAALKGLCLILDSFLDLTGYTQEILSTVVSSCITFLAKKDQVLRNQSVTTLVIIMRKYGSSLPPDVIANVISGSQSLMSVEDLSLSQLIWVLVSEINLHSSGRGLSDEVFFKLVDEMIGFLHSDLLQGAALNTLSSAFASFLKLDSKTITFNWILHRLTTAGKTEGTTRHSLHSISRCVASIVLSASAENRNSSIVRFTSEVSSQDSRVQILSLLSLGEVGKKNDLSAIADIEIQVLKTFSSPDENVRYAASVALGSIAAGNLARFIPVVQARLVESGRNDSNLYNLLNSLKEAISLTGTSFFPYTDEIASVLQAKISVDDDAIRSLISECLGRLITIAPSHLLPVIDNLISSPVPAERFVGITSLKFIATVDWQTLNDGSLNFDLTKCFVTLKDPNVDVCRQALLTFDFIANTNPSVMELGGMSLKDVWIPAIYTQTIPRPDLVRIEDFGAFSERIDTHLPTRKAAFKCVETLLKKFNHRTVVRQLLETIAKGFNDEEYDVILLAYGTMRLAVKIVPNSVLELLDTFPEKFIGRIKSLLKPAGGEKLNEKRLARQVLAGFLLLMKDLVTLPKVEVCHKFLQFHLSVMKTALLKSMLEEMEEKS